MQPLNWRAAIKIFQIAEIVEVSGDLPGFGGETKHYPCISNLFLLFGPPIPSLNKMKNCWLRRNLADFTDCTDGVQWYLLCRKALPSAVQNKPAVQSAEMSSSEVSEEIRNMPNTYCPQMNQKWPFLAKSQASEVKGLPAGGYVSL